MGVRAGVAMLAALPGLVLATSKFVYRLRLALTAAADSIEQWLRTHNREPKTNVQLRSKNLIPNHSLRASIQEFAANNGAGLCP